MSSLTPFTIRRGKLHHRRAKRSPLNFIVEQLIHMYHRYSDNEYEYRHVQLPKEMLKRIPKDYFDPSKGTLKLLWEEEWRGLGITQVHFATLSSVLMAFGG